jgi:hypothetical protein
MNVLGHYWQLLDRFVEMRSPWLTLIGEHLQDERGQVVEYWRIEKADSAVILPILNGHLILPTPNYRPGVGEPTLDFPGGRVAQGQNPSDVVRGILQRELGVASEEIAQITPLNTQGWAVNSSFSNQKLYGFVVNLQPTATIPANRIAATYPITQQGIHTLLQDLSCLQCRAVLMEWCTQELLLPQALAQAVETQPISSIR